MSRGMRDFPSKACHEWGGGVMATEKSLGERVCSYELCNEFLFFFNLTRMVRNIFDIR